MSEENKQPTAEETPETQKARETTAAEQTAPEAEKKEEQAAEEEKTHTNLIRAAFPPKDQLVSRYPILKKKPALLPFIWLCRLGNYGFELIMSPKNDNSLRDSVALGKRRTEMMIQYGIIPRDKT